MSPAWHWARGGTVSASPPSWGAPVLRLPSSPSFCYGSLSGSNRQCMQALLVPGAGFGLPLRPGLQQQVSFLRLADAGPCRQLGRHKPEAYSHGSDMGSVQLNKHGGWTWEIWKHLTLWLNVWRRFRIHWQSQKKVFPRISSAVLDQYYRPFYGYFYEISLSWLHGCK